MCGLKFMYEAPNQTAANRHSESDHEEANQGLHRQNVMWDPCYCGISHSTKWQFIPDISEPIDPSFKGQEIKEREPSITEVNWHNLFFGTLSII